VPEKIETTRFGRFTVNDEDLIHFPKGIPGFETHKKWALAGEDDSPIKWLQSLSDGDVALPVVVPYGEVQLQRPPSRRGDRLA